MRKSNGNEISQNIRSVFFMLGYIKKISIISLLVLCLTAIAKGLLPTFQNLLNKEIIDEITECISVGWKSSLLVYLICFVLIQCLSFFMSWSENYVVTHIGDRIANLFRNLIVEKCKKVQYKYFYNKDFYDNLEKASREVYSSPFSSIQGIIYFFMVLIRLLAALIILGSFNFLIVVVLLLFAFPASYFDNKYRVKSFALINKMAPNRRRLGYFFELYKNKDSLKEIRLNNSEAYFQKKMNNEFDDYHSLNISHYNKYGLIILLSTFLNILAQGTVYLWLAKMVVSGKITLGAFTLYSATAFQFVGLFGDTITVLVGVRNTLGFINNLRDFISFESYDEPECPSPESLGEVCSLEFKNVSFSYENNPSFELKNVSFRINKGERVAIIGENGAGKTTLLMLLMRFYEPSSGEILLNGVNIQNYSLSKYREKCATVFQDYVLFSQTLRENIAMGKIEKMNNDDAIRETCEKAQLSQAFSPLDEFLNKYIGSEFENGLNLSVGQKQRIAVARAVFKEGEILIFDEPTASMDANSEYELMNEYQALTEGKISFIVSHRLSSATMVDQILFLQDGQITEQGTHEELMKIDKEYATMFKKQASHYSGLQ